MNKARSPLYFEFGDELLFRQLLNLPPLRPTRSLHCPPKAFFVGVTEFNSVARRGNFASPCNC